MAKEAEEKREDLVEISRESLDLNKYMNAVRDARAGAIATFAGTTRNSFNGRKVLQLEYEAYEPMAIRQMQAICSAARARWPLIALSCAHRIGIVPIGHESVFVAASSVHRADALLACRFIIDEIKSSVPIWKKEVYSDGQVWKENVEFFAKKTSFCQRAGGAMKESWNDGCNCCVDKEAYREGHIVNEDTAGDRRKAIDVQHVGHVIKDNSVVGGHEGQVVNGNMACEAKESTPMAQKADVNDHIACLKKDGPLSFYQKPGWEKKDSLHEPGPSMTSDASSAS